jgi:hypothetical protein
MPGLIVTGMFTERKGAALVQVEHEVRKGCERGVTPR